MSDYDIIVDMIEDENQPQPHILWDITNCLILDVVTE